MRRVGTHEPSINNWYKCLFFRKLSSLFNRYMIDIQSFKQYLLYEKRYSEHTIAAYSTDVRYTLDYVAQLYQITQLSQIEPFHLRSWVVDLMARKQGARSINRKISSIRTFFKYQIRRGVVSKDPTIKLRAVKVPRRLPNYLQEHEITFLDVSVVELSDLTEMRDILILKTLYACGLRRAELINLTVSSIDMEKRCLTVTGKGDKMRLVPISKSYAHEMIHYLAEREKALPPSEYLFMTDKGKKLYPKFVYNLVRKYLTRYSTTTQKGPHTLRHTFATHLSNRGADLNAIKDLLGHANLSATQIYTHNNIEKLKRAYAAHPKA
ncbi:MAG: tyrosine-type recombinase/integrase [Saprospiraceae bacterium]|nr:tyrosine-type recombinase/integrase [Saprospiraceae bacterium]